MKTTFLCASGTSTPNPSDAKVWVGIFGRGFSAGWGIFGLNL